MSLLLFESKFEYKLSSYNVILRNIDSQTTWIKYNGSMEGKRGILK